MPETNFNRFIFLAIFLVGGLNYALMLGTLNLITDTYPVLASLDLVRTESSFFLFVGFTSACFLIPFGRFLTLRRVFILVLLSVTLFTAHISTVVAQLTSEAGPMHKVLFYVS